VPYIQEITLSQTQTVLTTDVLKYCDVLALGFVKNGKDRREVNGT
jgi:hypothetical protein